MKGWATRTSTIRGSLFDIPPFFQLAKKATQ